MKIACESCGAHYDLDEARIPASGLIMKCPACLHQFTVRKGQGAAAPPPVGTPPPPAPPPKREIALSDLDDIDAAAAGVTDDSVDLPAPVQKKPSLFAEEASRTAELDEIDLPAPVTAPRAAATASPSAEDEIDLPAPKPGRPATILGAPPPPPPSPPPPTGARPSTMLGVGPATPKTPPPTPPPKPAPPPPPAIALAIDDGIDLPAPVAPSASVDLPAPVQRPATSAPIAPPPPPPAAMAAAPPTIPSVPRFDGPDAIDLPAPLRATSSAVDLDAPDEDDLALMPRRPTPPPAIALDPDGGPPALALDVDLGARSPASAGGDQPDLLAPRAAVRDDDLLAPRGETMDVAPRAQAVEVAPVGETLDVAPVAPATDLAPVGESRPGKRPPPRDARHEGGAGLGDNGRRGDGKVVVPDDGRPPRSRRGLLLGVIGGGALLGAVGVGMGLFTDSGFFGANLWSGKRRELEAKIVGARRLLADDTLASYKRAAGDLRALLGDDGKNVEAQALEAEARLWAARLGATSEARAAENALDKIVADPKAAEAPDVRRAQALRSLVANKVADARAKLTAYLKDAPTDADALVALGTLELGAGDAAAADAAFGRALAAEPTRAGALYGAAVAKERLGDLAKAAELYKRAREKSPSHAGALVGAARVAVLSGGDAQAARAQIDELVQKRATQIGSRELADAWATLGLLAARGGQIDEAEDRYKRAVQLDPSSVAARLGLARAQCDAGRCKEATAPLEKLVAEQPKEARARLLLVRALVETGQLERAQAVFAPIASTKSAEVAYWDGRLLAAKASPERDKAVARFEEAIALDAKYLPAYLAASRERAALGKSDEALATLKRAEEKASGDAQMTLELGDAYLALGRAADAEARYRAVRETNPESVEAALGLGAALEAQNKDAEAGALYDALAKAAPPPPGLAERQARLLAKAGKTAEAYAKYQEVLKGGMATATARLQAAELAIALGKPNEARDLVAAVVRDDERSARAHLVGARALVAAGSLPEALAEARRAATLEDSTEAHLELGRILEGLNKLDQAMTEYNLARRPPHEAQAALGRARILVRMGATKDALAELGALAKVPATRAAALILEGDAHADLRETDKARKAYEDATRADPKSGEAAFKLGRALADAGKRKPAIAELERALKLVEDRAPWAAEAYLLLGDAHREAKDGPAALKAYRRYLEIAPADAPPRSEVKKHIAILGG